MDYNFISFQWLYLAKIVDTSLTELSIVVCVSLSIIVYLLSSKKDFSLLIVLGFILRLIVMLFDYYDLASIPHSGADSEMFNYLARNNINNNYPFYLTNYTYVLTKFYEFTYSSRLLAQFINVLFSLGVLLLLRKCLYMLSIKRKIMLKVMLVLVLMPQLLFLSGVLLRESWVIFFVTLSLYYFIKWYKNNNKISVLLCYLSVIAAMWMHEGLVGLLPGYTVAFFLYNHKLKKWSLTPLSIFLIIFLLPVMAIGISISGLLGEKMDNLDSKEFVEMTSSLNEGGSAYLQWISSTSVVSSLGFAPLKMFYFQFSPIPLDWRGILDVMAFLFDGLVYLLIFYIIFRYRKIQGDNNSLRAFLIISIIFTIFIFAYGTFNSGTAIRHRTKFISLVLIAYAVTENNRYCSLRDHIYEKK